MSKNKILAVLLTLTIVITYIAIPPMAPTQKSDITSLPVARAATNPSIATDTPINEMPEPRPIATAATVTAVGMDKEEYHVMFSSETPMAATTTISAIVTVTGSSLELLKADDITITAVPATCGIVVSDLATKAAVTASAKAVTLEAIINVPNNTPEGIYALAASTSAVVNGGFKDEIAMIYVSYYYYYVPPAPPIPKIIIRPTSLTMGVTEKAKLDIKTNPIKAINSISVFSKNTKVVTASIHYASGKITLKAQKPGVTKVIIVHNGNYSKRIAVTVRRSPNKLTLKSGKKSAKKTINMRANGTKRKPIKKSYKIILPKNTASHAYSIKLSGKKAIIQYAKILTNKKGEQNLVIVVKKRARGSAKVTITPNANKKIRAVVNIRANRQPTS